jgi:hypothetical protein
MLEGFDTAEPDMVGAAVGAVDHRIGFARQFVVQAAIDQPPDDRRLSAAAFDDIVGDSAIFTALGKGAVHGLDDVPAKPEVAQVAFGVEPDHPLAGAGG